MADYSTMSDADLLALVQPKQTADFSKMSDSDLMKLVGKQEPKGFVANAMDFAKSIPHGIMGGISNALSASGQSAAHEMSQPDLAAEIPNPQDTQKVLEQNVTGQTHVPEGRAGRFGAAIGEGLGNPLSYIGPGGLPLKIGGSILSSAGGEVAGQTAEGTPYEGPARVAGALAGGVAGVKALGPGVEKAAIPTSGELFAAGDKGYKTARNSGLELHPQGVSSWASKVEQELSGPDYGFTGGKYGTAPKTLDIVERLQNPPAGAIITASNIDTIRKNLRNISEETQPAQGGFAKPTPDAKAASIALENLGQYTENIPASHILAGNATDYVRALKQANGDWAAGSRVRDFDARLTKAENATDRQVAGSLDSQIKSKAGQMLDNPQRLRGLNTPERDQLQLINSGDWKSNSLRQLGRGGAGVIPIMGQLAAAGPVFAAAGPAGLAVQGGVAATLYGARKGSEAITKSRAKALAEMLAKRSPEYEARASAIGPQDKSPNIAAMARALLAH